MNTAQNGKGSRARKVDGERYRSSKLWDKPKACRCHQCEPDAGWMVVCPKCGNKRCPKARHHKWKCTNSNDTHQIGELEDDSDAHYEATGIPAPDYDPDDVAFDFKALPLTPRPRTVPRLVPVVRTVLEPGDEVTINGVPYRMEAPDA